MTFNRAGTRPISTPVGRGNRCETSCARGISSESPMTSRSRMKHWRLRMPDPLKFIAPMPRLWKDGATWVSEVRRLETLGFDTVAVSQHVTSGWQLSPLAAMAFAAANTSRLRVLSLVVQNDLHHPALLAKDIATIDALSHGRIELGIGS